MTRVLRALLVTLAQLACLAPAGAADRVAIAAAADLKFALDELVARFERAHPGTGIEVTYGSSGKLHAQIRQGAPFDLFFSADIAYPRELVTLGLAAGDVQRYAVGRLALWSAQVDASKLTLADLASHRFSRIAIANPRHAPYGRSAEEALRAAGVWDSVRPRLVYGENVAQAAQFVATGNAEVGIIALSLALSPGLAARGSHALVPESLHAPLEQGFVVTRRAADDAGAAAFAAYMTTEDARAVMARYGFVLPERTVQ